MVNGIDSLPVCSQSCGAGQSRYSMQLTIVFHLVFQGHAAAVQFFLFYYGCPQLVQCVNRDRTASPRPSLGLTPATFQRTWRNRSAHAIIGVDRSRPRRTLDLVMTNSQLMRRIILPQAPGCLPTTDELLHRYESRLFAAFNPRVTELMGRPRRSLLAVFLYFEAISSSPLSCTWIVVRKNTLNNCKKYLEIRPE